MNEHGAAVNPNPGRPGPIRNPEAIKRRIPEVLLESFGNVSITCKKLGISQETFCQWAKNNDEILTAQYFASEAALDFVESKLMSQIAEGNATCIIFYLKTRGKRRGYTQELNLNVGSENPFGNSYTMQIADHGDVVMHSDDKDILERYVAQRICEISAERERKGIDSNPHQTVVEAKAPKQKKKKEQKAASDQL